MMCQEKGEEKKKEKKKGGRKEDSYAKPIILRAG